MRPDAARRRGLIKPSGELRVMDQIFSRSNPFVDLVASHRWNTARNVVVAHEARHFRIRIAAIALSIAVGSIGGAGSAQSSAKDKNVSGAISSKRMADGKEWTTANLDVNAD
jgi:hypothetical protein